MTRSVLRVIVIGALLAVAPGCVTRGTHQEVVAERDRLAEESRRLAERVKLLEASNQSLSAERVQLLEEVEDLRQERSELDRSITRLRQVKDELEASLAARERELAARTREIERLQGTYEALVSDLEQEIAAGQIQIDQLREGLRLNVSDEILFPSGSAELTAQGEQVLEKVAEQLRKIPHRVEVHGHTDNVPISGALARRYPTNWELAAARASRVVRLLESQQVEPDRLTAVSRGEHHPVAPNDTPEGRARNRRIEIRLIPLQSESLPAQAAE